MVSRTNILRIWAVCVAQTNVRAGRMGEEYVELPLYGRAGTCCFYDIACYHTRLDGDGEKMRRTMQHYFSRGGWVEDAEPARVPAPLVPPPRPPRRASMARRRR